MLAWSSDLYISSVGVLLDTITYIQGDAVKGESFDKLERRYWQKLLKSKSSVTKFSRIFRFVMLGIGDVWANNT